MTTSYKVIILDIAVKDVKEAINWYNDQRIGLGKEFDLEFKKTVVELSLEPHYQVVYKNIHQRLLNRFPYLIHYLLDEPEKVVKIIGVTHARRDPRVWKKKLK